MHRSEIPAAPSAIVHIRKFKPLSVSLPPPGLYRGRIAVILPHPDPTVLGRLYGDGDAPFVLMVDLDGEISASQLLRNIIENTPALERALARLASPFQIRRLQKLLLSRALPRDKTGRQRRVEKTGDVENPYDDVSDNAEPPDSSDNARLVS